MKKIELEEMKKIQIEILKFIDDVCKENNIKYFLIGGSLIGAIRNNGIIPWDDDIDIGMTRNDYKKFKEVFKKINSDNNKKYIMLDNSINNSYYFPFMKIVDKRTIMYEKELKEIDNYGVYVDVFAYNGMPANEKDRVKHYKKIQQIQKIIFCYEKKKIVEKNLLKKIIKQIAAMIISCIGIKKFIALNDKLCEKYDICNSEYAISNWPVYSEKKEIKRSEWLLKTEYHKFENINALILSEYDKFLSSTFGDYMKLPPEEKRIPKHGLKVYWRE